MTAGRTLVVYTGGTFGMRDSGRGLAAVTDLRAEISALADRVLGGPTGVGWAYAATDRIIDSAEATHEIMLGLADLIRERAAGGGARGAVVIHGTDTLAYAAAHAAFALADLDLPVVFTGAQFPLGTAQGDAEQNFSDALRLASSAPVPGVRLVFGGRQIPAVRALKRSADDREAFTAHRELVSDSAEVPDELRVALASAPGRPAPRVALLKLVPGTHAADLAGILASGPGALVLECYGAGTAPTRAPGMTEALETARDRGIPVLAVTQCEHGELRLGRYELGSELADAGVIDGGDMTVEAAVAKLAALLRAGLSGPELRTALEQNLIGERAPFTSHQ